ncbi:AAA family ATPase [Mucilaginibacter jinjuensis]|uniref:AAA family ATPase n=1 Tax=Mucilaginibacter jinjuensis TaxID=1176721 RepID=A0ABY7T523_9SPHI|nr:AAA family ATPase [Mucilaginibacter jinjuensis]WCT11565.1 AAA family ATPase [Mucilaginibacter jinjuensis]
MAIQLSSITEQNVYDAVADIQLSSLVLHPSTGYEVVINQKRYPPKEIIRYAYRIATGEEPGTLYGGEQVNRILSNLGFPVERKIKLWKLGCNWDSGSPSFFDLIHEYSIVITVDKFPYGEGDIVLITEGFTVVALGKVKTKLRPITERPELQDALENRLVPFESWLLFGEVEWYDLTESQMFLYKLRQGIRQVSKQDVVHRVLDIWENRGLTYNQVNFYVKESNEKYDDGWRYPCLVLIPNKWKDYEFKTCFDLFFYTDRENRQGFGEIKIMQLGTNITRLDKHFTELGPQYCSLGQTLAFYKDLKEFFPSEYMEIGRALQDCVFFPEIRAPFEHEPAFRESLIRTSEAQRVLYETGDLLQSGLANPEPSFQFTFHYTVPGAALPHKIDFSFNNDSEIPNSFFCLVGKNGTGKTQVLTQLAKKLCNSSEQGKFIPERPLFTKVIAVSFSLFDNFDTPSAELISYELISFKDKKGLVNVDETSQVLWQAYNQLLKSRTRKAIWLNCIRNYLDVDFMRIDITQLETLRTKQQFEQQLNSALSSGQHIIFHFITRLVAVIEENSIVIFDEPETHLHPNIVSKQISALRYLLRNFSSVCVLATHSPVIVQEIPSRFIRIIERQDDIPLIRGPLIEVLGENLTNINNDIFHVDQDSALYKTLLEELSKRFTLDQIHRIFNDQLSLNARVYLQTIINQGNDQL